MPASPLSIAELGRAVRRLRRSPSFALVVVATIAIGIGANTAIFSVVRGVLVEPLALPDPARVVNLWSTRPERGERHGGVSRQDADDWRTLSHSFTAIGTYVRQEGNIIVGREPLRVEYAYASHHVFQALAVPPAMGRTLTRDDDGPGHADVAVVSHGFWLRVLGADSAVIGRTIRVDSRPLTIVGVMPQSFEFPTPGTALWTPFTAPPDETGPRIARWVSAVARLAPGVPLESAQREMSEIARRLGSDYPASNDGVGVLLETQQETMTGDIRPLLLLTWAVVAIVLLIVGANVANLTLTRAIARDAEMVVRAALGATRRALISQHLTESLILAIAGGVAGLGLAALVLPIIRGLDSIGIPRAETITLHPWVVAYCFGLVIFLGVSSGLVPALASSTTTPFGALRRGGGWGTTSGHGRDWLRAIFTAAQIALAVVVLVGAGLLARSFERLSRVDPGFTARSGAVFRLAPDRGSYPDRALAVALYDELETRLRADPRVTDVGAVNRAPLTGSWWTTEYVQQGASYVPGHEPTAWYRVVTPGYLNAMGIPLLKGRGIETRDGAKSQPVVMVSRNLAEHAWPHADPIGRRITFAPNTPGAVWYTVVGVVGDVHTSGLADAPEGLAYVSIPQSTYGFFGDWGMDIIVRSRGGATAATSAARRILHDLAPTIPMFEVRPLTSLIAQDLARRRLLLLLFMAFAATAMVLAGVGLFAVVAYGVNVRRRELGLRLALGAEARRVRHEVVIRGLGVAGVGLAIGLIVAAGVTRFLTSLLFGVAPADAVTYVEVTVVILGLALSASWLPALRAGRIDPMVALKGE